MTVPAVSVIVPTYNRGPWIAATLRTVLAQTHRALEIIVIDDGSTDDTEAVVAGFGPALTYVRQDNAGVSAARNHGARLASGEYVAFVDSDDLWHPRKLEVQLLALRRVGAHWSITGCDVIGLDDNVIPGREGFPAVFPLFKDEGVTPPEFFAQYFRRDAVEADGQLFEVFAGDAYDALFLGNFGLPSSSMIAKGLFEQVGGFNPAFRIAEETEFFHRIAAVAEVAIVTTSLVGYRTSQSGSLVSPANSSRLIENALASLERAATLRAIRTARGSANWQRGRRKLMNRLAYTRLSNFDGAGARAALRDAWAAGAPRGAWSLALFGASLLPAPVLRALHSAKKGFK
jgi:glycosyltransferase involved in cell wall biosynthesis